RGRGGFCQAPTWIVAGTGFTSRLAAPSPSTRGSAGRPVVPLAVLRSRRRPHLTVHVLTVAYLARLAAARAGRDLTRPLIAADFARGRSRLTQRLARVMGALLAIDPTR